jgi:hypothetical protein
MSFRSRRGNVSMTPIERIAAFWEKVDKNGDCWLWIGAVQKEPRGGYGMVHYDGKCTKTHRISWVLHNGIIPDGMQVLHTCDVRNCVNPNHLFLGTNRDNVDDKVRKGRQTTRNQIIASWKHDRKGENQFCSKYTDTMVLAMRCLFRGGVRIKEISDVYGIPSSTVSGIVYGDRWPHLPGISPKIRVRELRKLHEIKSSPRKGSSSWQYQLQ